jgi:replicative DNA helicase
VVALAPAGRSKLREQGSKLRESHAELRESEFSRPPNNKHEAARRRPFRAARAAHTVSPRGRGRLGGAVTDILTREPPPRSGEPTPRLARLGDLLGEWEADATAAHQARLTGMPRGPVTGLAGLDLELGGVLEPGVHVVHAGPGVGKTALCLQVAVSCGCPSLYVTCEMKPLELLRRITARLTGTFLGRLKSGELDPAACLRLARQAVAAAPRVVLADATQAFASAAWIRDAAEVTRGDQEHLLIVVDSVHSWAEAFPGDVAEYDRLNLAIGALRSLAGGLGCPVLAIAERNRASMASGGMNASAGSRRFEYSGASVWDLATDKDAHPDATGAIPVTLTLAKNRNGAAGRRLYLTFHGALQRFAEVG